MDQEGSWFARNSSVGTGPYKIASREPGTRIVLEQHTEYWGGWNDNKFETVAIEIVENTTVREQMIRSTAVESAQADPENAHDFIFLQWFPTYVTPFDPMFSPFANDQYFNLSFYSNPDFEDLLFGGDGITATDRDGAIEMFQQVNKMLIDEVAAIFIMDSPYLWQIRDDLSGYQYSPSYGHCLKPTI